MKRNPFYADIHYKGKHLLVDLRIRHACCSKACGSTCSTWNRLYVITFGSLTKYCKPFTRRQLDEAIAYNTRTPYWITACESCDIKCREDVMYGPPKVFWRRCRIAKTANTLLFCEDAELRRPAIFVILTKVQNCEDCLPPPVCMYVCMYVCMCVYIYIYIYIERERER